MDEIQLLLQQLVAKVVRNEEQSRPKIEDLCKLKIRHVTTETIFQNEDPSEIAVSESFDDALKIIGQFCINAGVKRCLPYRKGIIVKVGKIHHREIIHWYRRSERFIFQNKTKTCSDDAHLEGMPFISFGGNIYSCQFNETNEMTGELKLGESVVLRKIATFPTFKLKSNTESEMNDKEALLREQLKNNSKSVDRKLAYLISFPRDIRRKSLHIDGDVSSLITLLKLKSAVLFPSILTKVEDLILQDLSYHQIDQYIRNEMFDQKTPPAKTDQRYYPDFSRLTDIRRVMLSANTLKLEDIDHLDKSFQELKEKKNGEIYFKVYQHQPPSPSLNGYKRPQNDSSFNQENSVDFLVDIPSLPGTSRCNKSTVPNSVCAENESKKRRKKPNLKYQIPAYPNYQLQANRKYQRESRKRTKINTLLLESDRILLLKNAPYKHKRAPLKPPIWDSPIQRFLLFHQSQSQQYLLNRYGSFVYITEVQPKSIGYKAANGVASFLICVRTNVDCQVVGTILCNKYNDQAQVLKEALTEFKEINEFWRPKYLMIDPSDAMVNSVGEVFPGVDYYFNSNSCIQEWEKKLKDSPSDVTEQFETIIEMMKDLQTSPLEEIGILLTRTVRMVKSVNFPRYHFWISQRKKWASCYFPMDLSFFLRDDWLCKTTEKYELQLRNYSRKNSSGLVRLMENIITQMADSQYKRYVLINQELNDSGLKIVKEYSSLNDQYGLPLHMMTHCAPIVKRLNSGHSSKSEHFVSFGNQKSYPSCTCDEWKNNRLLCRHFLLVFKRTKTDFTSLSPLYLANPCFRIDSLAIKKAVKDEKPKTRTIGTQSRQESTEKPKLRSFGTQSRLEKKCSKLVQTDQLLPTYYQTGLGHVYKINEIGNSETENLAEATTPELHTNDAVLSDLALPKHHTLDAFTDEVDIATGGKCNLIQDQSPINTCQTGSLIGKEHFATSPNTSSSLEDQNKRNIFEKTVTRGKNNGIVPTFKDSTQSRAYLENSSSSTHVLSNSNFLGSMFPSTITNSKAKNSFTNQSNINQGNASTINEQENLPFSLHLPPSTKLLPNMSPSTITNSKPKTSLTNPSNINDSFLKASLIVKDRKVLQKEVNLSQRKQTARIAPPPKLIIKDQKPLPKQMDSILSRLTNKNLDNLNSTLNKNQTGADSTPAKRLTNKNPAILNSTSDKNLIGADSTSCRLQSNIHKKAVNEMKQKGHSQSPTLVQPESNRKSLNLSIDPSPFLCDVPYQLMMESKPSSLVQNCQPPNKSSETYQQQKTGIDRKPRRKNSKTGKEALKSTKTLIDGNRIITRYCEVCLTDLSINCELNKCCQISKIQSRYVIKQTSNNIEIVGGCKSQDQPSSKTKVLNLNNTAIKRKLSSTEMVDFTSSPKQLLKKKILSKSIELLKPSKTENELQKLPSEPIKSGSEPSNKFSTGKQSHGTTTHTPNEQEKHQTNSSKQAPVRIYQYASYVEPLSNELKVPYHQDNDQGLIPGNKIKIETDVFESDIPMTAPE